MQTLLFEMFMYNYSPWIKWALKLCANPLWMKYLILRFSANSTMAHLSKFKNPKYSLNNTTIGVIKETASYAVNM